MLRRLISALAVLAATVSVPALGHPGATAAAVDAVARRYQLAGEMLVARGDRILLNRGYGTIAPLGGRLHKVGERWRLASISKQVTAALLVGRVALDTPIGFVSPSGAFTITRRQLLLHHSGLANPDATPSGPDGIPAFYRKVTPDIAYCSSKAATPGSAFSYNNCDYILAAYRQKLTWPAGMAMARAGEIGVPGFIGGKPEPKFQLASYHAAGGLIGTARAVFDFDRSLMTGKLLPTAARDELWRPEGNGSYQALGQWVFPGQLKGCAKPKRIVQRDGEIQGVQTRNFIFPDDDLVVIAFTNRSADDFPLGEVWEGRGFVFDLLSAAACP